MRDSSTMMSVDYYGVDGVLLTEIVLYGRNTIMATKCESNVRRMAGIVVLAGLLGGWFISSWVYLLTAFAGVNLLQSSFTDICPAESMLSRLGLGC
ncbi:MAG: protein of unknown function (DUF2892) [Haloquadratum walsbyi J07HQW1]|jgi:hypothetical protein|uniref:Inner membrane protein YgaP-like transmembrane domain-containing protein n=1 Tax=Haloquadratum walsbyi J07HQW1 TaxID=1238424 RepID=U1PLU6_9EURY|nr:MAG: protein of unknown function (DUF2892) [Haloquadratum walsbyi J07HQW1]